MNERLQAILDEMESMSANTMADFSEHERRIYNRLVDEAIKLDPDNADAYDHVPSSDFDPNDPNGDRFVQYTNWDFRG